MLEAGAVAAAAGPVVRTGRAIRMRPSITDTPTARRSTAADTPTAATARRTTNSATQAAPAPVPLGLRAAPLYLRLESVVLYSAGL